LVVAAALAVLFKGQADPLRVRAGLISAIALKTGSLIGTLLIQHGEGIGNAGLIAAAVQRVAAAVVAFTGLSDGTQASRLADAIFPRGSVKAGAEQGWCALDLGIADLSVG
jgi:hypothetical protein